MSTSPPQSHLGRAHRYPHVGECTVPLPVLAVACTMHNEALRHITERYGSTVHRYGTLRNVTEHRGTLWNVIEVLRKRYRCCQALTLRSITGALWSSYGMEHYGTVTENIDFAYH